MKKLIFFLVVQFICCGCAIIKGENYDWRYIYSGNGKNVLTIIQYLDYKDNVNSAYYIYIGKIKKSNKLPTSNYLKLTIDTEPLWIKFNDDKNVEIVFSVGKVLKKNLADSILSITKFYDWNEFQEGTKGQANLFKKVYFSKLPE